PALERQDTTPPLHASIFSTAAESSDEPVLAARGVRLAAMLIDGFLSIVFAMPGMILMALHLISQGGPIPKPEEIDPTQLGIGFSILLAGMFVLVAIQTWMLTMRGQTIGKRMMKIQILRSSDDSSPGFVRVVLLRAWVPALIINYVPALISANPAIAPLLLILLYLADVCFIFRTDRRCLHDHLAGTKVVELSD
ncbi:MAG: RDD family protein, partial [Opitutaceae bacterium]